MYYVAKGLRNLSLSALLVVSAGSVTAAVTPKGKNKPVGPSQQDYYSTVQADVSPEDLKKADDLRLQTIASIRELLKKKSNDSRKFELYLRLGELHAERHDYLREVESLEYDRRFNQWAEGGKKGKEPQLNTKRSVAELSKAAEAFRMLVTAYPKHPRTASALYALSKTLGRLNNESAVLYFQQLVKRFPKSPLLSDAYLSLGEYHFDRHNMTEARNAYQQVLKHKAHKAYPYAVYKLGWTYYNLTPKDATEEASNYKRAVASFKLVVKLSEKNAGRYGRLDLRQEAVNDLVMVWAETEDIDGAWNYFKTIGERESFYALLEKLGNTYADQGKNVKAIALYNRLLQESPNRPRNPQIYAKMAGLFEQENNLDAVVATLETMKKMYLGSSSWTIAFSKDAALLAEARKVTEFNMHRYGTMFHNRGQKAKNNAMLAASSKIYSLYLATFADGKNAYEIRYYLAEILFDMGQFETASQQYLAVAKADPKGKYLKPAALQAVAAMNKVDLKAKYDKLPPAGQVASPIALPATKKKLIDTIDVYVSMLPREKGGYPMRYTVAQIYFDYGHYDVAIDKFDKITKELPQTTQGRTSALVVLAYYADKAEWAKVVEWSDKFLNAKTLMTADLRTKVTEIKRNATYQQALAFEKQQNHDAAATAFVNFQKQFPKDANADRALYNATSNYYKVGKVEDALAVGKILMTTYPKSPLVANVLVDSAQSYEALAQFDQAADHYRRFAIDYANDKRAPAALYNAATLYKGLKNYSRSEQLYTRFVKFYPNQQGVGDAAFQVAMMQEKAGRHKEAVAMYLEFARKFATDKDQALHAEAKAADLKSLHLDAAGGRKDLWRLHTTLAAKSAPAAVEARRTVAGGLFRLMDQEFSAFKSTPINDVTRVEKQVQRKQQSMVATAKGYEAIITIGSAEHTVASLYRLGEMHENFAESLLSLQAPRESAQVEQDKFKTQMEKVAFPLKDEAFKYYQTAFKRSQEGEAFSDWTRRTYQKMAELSPQKHPEIIEQSADPTYMVHRLQAKSDNSGMVE